MASTHGSHNVPGTSYSLTLTTAQEAGASLSPPQKENTALRFMTCAEVCGQALHPVSSEDGPSPGKDRGEAMLWEVINKEPHLVSRRPRAPICYCESAPHSPLT